MSGPDPDNDKAAEDIASRMAEAGGLEELPQTLRDAGLREDQVQRLLAQIYSTVRQPPTRRERALPMDVFRVKRKLGRGWHSKRIGERTRRKRLAELTKEEWAIAKERGWAR